MTIAEKLGPRIESDHISTGEEGYVDDHDAFVDGVALLAFLRTSKPH